MTKKTVKKKEEPVLDDVTQESPIVDYKYVDDIDKLQNNITDNTDLIRKLVDVVKLSSDRLNIMELQLKKIKDRLGL